MQTGEFAAWLGSVRDLGERTVTSRVNNCERIERYEGDLDRHFKTDRMANLLGRLAYSTDDERHRRAPRHHVPIDGNIRTGTATLKSAATLYKAFREDGDWLARRSRDRKPGR